MDRNADASADYRQPHIPSDTPPAIDRNASANGGGDRDFPGEQPDEIVPDQGDNEFPGERPDEVAPDQGDFDQPDSSPIESPPPMETPPPPD